MRGLDRADISEALEKLRELAKKHKIIGVQAIRVEVHNVISDFAYPIEPGQEFNPIDVDS